MSQDGEGRAASRRTVQSGAAEPGRGSTTAAEAATRHAAVATAEPVGDRSGTPTDPTGTGHADHPASAPRPDSSSRPATPRDPFLDNAKYLAIVLVAIGHSWAPMVEHSESARALYMVLYAFHMPAFIVISGYLSRSFTGTPRQIKRLVTGVALPYLVFQTAYTFFVRWAADDPDHGFDYQSPDFALWFLVALFLWRLTAPIWRRLRWPLPIALAVAVAASVTPDIGGDLDLMRVAQFLPYFVLGMQLRPEHFDLLRRPIVRVASVPIVVGALLVVYFAVPDASTSWMGRDTPVQDLGHSAWTGAPIVLLVFACGVLLTACFLAWVPRRHRWCTVLGAGTLYAYLLHVYPIQLARESTLYDQGWVAGPLGQVGITVAAAVLMTLLCTPAVRRVFRPLVEPRLDWLFTRER